MKAGLVIFGIILIIVGFILAGYSSNQIGVCQSGIGKIAGFFSPTLSSECNTFNFLLIVGYGALIIGVIILILSFVIPGRHKYRQNRGESHHSSGNNSKFCRKCGTELEGHEKHCSSCGKKVK